MTKTPLLIYLHGFNSSPLSDKAQLTVSYIDSNRLDIETWVPKLPNDPKEVQTLLLDKIFRELTARPIYIMGSSLGGYYGTWLMEQLLKLDPDRQVRLVLVNPAVRPYELFEEYLGLQKNYHSGEEWFLTMDHVRQLRKQDVEDIHRPEDTLLLVQTGDETLDYRQAHRKYRDCHTITQKGGSHAFDNFQDILPAVFEFLSGKPPY